MKTKLRIAFLASILLSTLVLPGLLFGGEKPGTDGRLQRVNTLGPTDPMVNLVDGYFTSIAAKRPTYPVSDDRTFLRRVHLDLTGRYPEKERIAAFLMDANPGKRAALVDEIMASDAFATRWTYFLEELFFNSELVFPPVFRNSFHWWLREQVVAGTSWDQLVLELLTYRGSGYWEPPDSPDNQISPFIFWARESLNEEFRLDFLDDQTGYITQTLLGIRTECISCHDGANHLEQINIGLTQMKRTDFWAMAAMLASTYLYLPRAPIGYPEDELLLRDIGVVDFDEPEWDRKPGYYITDEGRRFSPQGEYIAQSAAGDGMRPPRSGGTIAPAYLFSGEQPRAGEPRREALARMITSDRQFARNMVNRLWAHFFGEGFVEPVDGWDPARLDDAKAQAHGTTVQAKDAVLMEYLTDFFINSGFDTHAFIKLLLNSRLYQADYAITPANEVETGLASWTTDRRVRRLQSEAVVDSFYQILETPRKYLLLGMGDRTFDSVWHMPSSLEPVIFAAFLASDNPDFRALGYENEREYFINQVSAQRLLDTLGRTNRADMVPTDGSSSIQIALTLMNDPLFHYAIFDEEVLLRGAWLGRLVDGVSSGGMDERAVVRELFLQILLRQPSADEEGIALQYFGANPAELAVRDLAWSLFNHPDFLYQ